MPAIGQDTLTAIARQYILPQVTDNVYLKNNALLYRLIRGNKRLIQGGTQIEMPMLYKRFNTGGSYSGFDLLDVAPQDTVKSASQTVVPDAVRMLLPPWWGKLRSGALVWQVLRG